MVEVESPLAKKPRLDDADAVSLKENVSASPTHTLDDNEIVIDDEDDVNISKSNPTTPKTPRTPGSKRRHELSREEKERQKLEKQRQRDAEKKEKEEKLLQEKREKEEERERQKQIRELEKQRKEDEKRQKQAEREAELQARREQKQREEEALKKAKEEERLRRKQEKEEEARRAKEEKQRLADEKKRQQEEEKRKAEIDAERKRQAQQIDKFLVRQKKPEPNIIPAVSNCWLFSDFEKKQGMTIAPTHRRAALTSEQKKALLNTTIDTSDYLQHLPKRPVTKINPMKVKFFQFTDNCRPPYRGTFRKRSKIVTGRKPFAREEILDYDYDSDAEWEAEEGDECKSDEESISDEENDEEDDDGFLVEHGYLSSDEGDAGDNERLPGESEEDRKKRLKERAEEWENEQKVKKRRHQIKELIPNQYGPCFFAPGDDVSPIIKEHLIPGIILCYVD